MNHHVRKNPRGGGAHTFGVLALAGLFFLGNLARGQTVDGVFEELTYSAVYPPHGFSGRAEHALHAELLSCDQCHQGIDESSVAGDDHLPSMESCSGCHLQASDTETDGACAFCHDDYQPVWPSGQGLLSVRHPRFPLVGPEPTIRLEANLTFAHQRHLSVSCDGCHPPEVRGGAALPTEESCLDCHGNQGVANDCPDCHPVGDDGRLITEIEANQLTPTLLLRPDNHDALWDVEHGFSAAVDQTTCETCHLESDCLGCHDGTLSTQSPHPLGYLQIHAIQQATGMSDCNSCHTVSGFCVDCHIDMGMVTTSPWPERTTRNHPIDWVTSATNGHAVEAQMDLMACASCHPESDCVQCHALVSPHGADFGSSCDTMLSTNPFVCARCHSDAELDLLESQCE